MIKSKISAIDNLTGDVDASDSIWHECAAFLVLLPGQANKHLGMSLTLAGDFSQDKAPVTD
jgi:hypothetical protein